MRRLATVGGRIPGIDDLRAEAADADRRKRGPGIFVAFEGRETAGLLEDHIGEFIRGDTAGRADFESSVPADNTLPVRGRDFDAVKAEVGGADIGQNERRTGSSGQGKAIVVIPLV